MIDPRVLESLNHPPPAFDQITRVINFAALHGVVVKPTQVNTTPCTFTPRTPFITGRGALAAVNSFIYNPALAPAGQITLQPSLSSSSSVILNLQGVLNQRLVVDCQLLDSSVPLFAQGGTAWSVNLTYDANNLGSFLTPTLTSESVDIEIRWDNRHLAAGSRAPGVWTLLSCTVTPISA